MGMVGNARDAQLIRDHVRGERLCGRCLLPAGWDYLSSGVYRSCFVSPEGVVYKVDCYPDSGRGTNHGEYLNMTRCIKTPAPEGTRMPRFTYYKLDGDGVMAMERIHGEILDDYRYKCTPQQSAIASDLVSRMSKVYELNDLHDGNVMVEPSGTVVTVDWGI